MGIIHNNNLCRDTRFILYYNLCNYVIVYIYIGIVHIMILYMFFNVHEICMDKKVQISFLLVCTHHFMSQKFLFFFH